MFWLHLNDHWCFFLNFRWFYFKKGNHVCLKENAVPIWYFFSTVPKCLGAELSFLTGAEMSWCQTSLMHVTLYREDAPFFFTAPRILIFTIYSHFRTEIYISKHYYCVYWVTYIHLHTKVRPENTNIPENYQWQSGHFPALKYFPASVYIYSHSCPIDTL